MLRQFLVGGAVSSINVAIHALVMTNAGARGSVHERTKKVAVFGAVDGGDDPDRSGLDGRARHRSDRVVVRLRIVSAASDDANLVYFAFVNYTTLGYGDVLPLPRWRLLGP